MNFIVLGDEFCYVSVNIVDLCSGMWNKVDFFSSYLVGMVAWARKTFGGQFCSATEPNILIIVFKVCVLDFLLILEVTTILCPIVSSMD